MRLHSGILLLILSTRLHAYQETGFSKSIKSFTPIIISTLLATLGGTWLYRYYTRDSRLLVEAEQACASDQTMGATKEALKIIAHIENITLMTSQHPMGKKYHTHIKEAIREQLSIEKRAEEVHVTLQERKSAYAPESQFYQAASHLQEQLKNSIHHALHTRSTFMIVESLVVLAQFINAVHTHCNHLSILYNNMLTQTQNSPEQTEFTLSGIDNLKVYWLELDETIKKTSNYVSEILQQYGAIRQIMSLTPASYLSSALYTTCEQEIGRAQTVESSLSLLISALQKLQHAIGTHPRYAQDNQLYISDYTRMLMKENQSLKDIVNRLSETIVYLEGEKRSLYTQISNLEESIRALQWQVALAHNMPHRSHIIIT